MAAVSAANETDVVSDSPTDIETAPVDDSTPEKEFNDEAIGDNASQVITKITSDETNVVKGKEFTVKLTSDNGSAIANKSVKFTLNNKNYNSTTDSNGIAKIKVNLNPGTYTVKYSFASEGYTSCANSTKIFVVTTSTSKIKASDYTAYIGLKNTYTVTLTAGDTPLVGRTVTFNINGKTISKKTNSKGSASIDINEAKGTYTITYSYAGEKNINAFTGTSRVTVKNAIPTKISKANSVIYRNKKTGYLKIKLTDVRGNLLKSQKVIFTIKGKKYTKKTNSKGIATLKIKLKTGTYSVKVKFAKTSNYNKASKTIKIKVKPRQARNNGMWILSTDMQTVNFDTLQKYGTKHVFLNAKCIERFGKKYVESWVKQAKTHGIKVHLWMQVFYNVQDGWINPISNGKIKYSLINSKVKEAKSYAKVKGISGVHFDYIRFPGNAYMYKNAVKAVNTFTKKASTAVHKVNKKLIVSAAVMPEPSSMKKYYAQDIPTMSKYLNAIVPMVYKGNYHGNANWIKSVTKTFAKQSKKAKIWTGLQTYGSDENTNKLSAKELMNDADAAALGGAYGVIMFRYGLLNYINFNEV